MPFGEAAKEVGRRRELLNGHYAVYLKKGDPFSQRWHASTASFNFGVGPDDLLFAVSKGPDPTQGWAGFSIPFSGPIGITFVDMPALGFDRDADRRGHHGPLGRLQRDRRRPPAS